MGETNGRSSEVDANEAVAQAEASKIAQVRGFFQAIDMLLGTFGFKATTEEINAAQGRRTILAISDLRHQKATFYLEVVGVTIREVAPYERFHTKIEAPIDTVLRVLKGITEGDRDMLLNEKTRGEATLKGDFSVHDLYVMNQGFNRLADGIKRYRALLASGA